MIVTGDRDAYQLAENGSVRVMTTSRGITDTRVYDREGVVERYGVPPELVHRLHRAEGRHLGQHPRRPGHRGQDGRPAACSSTGRSRRCSRTSTTSRARSASRTCARTPTWRACPRSSRPSSATSTRASTWPRSSDRASGPLAAARGVQPLRAARPAAAPRGGARRAGGGAAREGRAAGRGDARAEGSLADLPDGPGALAARREDGMCDWAAAAGDEMVTGTAGRSPGRSRVGRAAGGRARLEVDRARRRRRRSTSASMRRWPGTRWSRPT